MKCCITVSGCNPVSKAENYLGHISQYASLLWEMAYCGTGFDEKRVTKLVEDLSMSREEIAWAELVTVCSFFCDLENSGKYNENVYFFKRLLSCLTQFSLSVSDYLIYQFDRRSVAHYKAKGFFFETYNTQGLGLIENNGETVYFREDCESLKYKVSSRTSRTSYSGYRSSYKQLIFSHQRYEWGTYTSTTAYENYDYKTFPDGEGTVFVTENELGFISERKQFHFPLSKIYAMQLYDDCVHIYLGNRQTPYILKIKDIDYFISVIIGMRYGFVPIKPNLISSSIYPEGCSNTDRRDGLLQMPGRKEFESLFGENQTYCAKSAAGGCATAIFAAMLVIGLCCCLV